MIDQAEGEHEFFDIFNAEDWSEFRQIIILAARAAHNTGGIAAAARVSRRVV